MGCLSLSLVVFCLAIATVLSTCPRTYTYRRANRCTGYRNQRCGMFGWSRCRRSYTYTCYRNEQRTCPAPSVSYGGWGSCTAPCGGGLQYRTKYVRCSSSCGGARTTTRESRRCNTGCCPVNGGWSATTYGSWGECSTSCGGGVQTRTLNRGCNNPTPSCNGRSCSGLASWQEDRACNPNPCPVDGGWSEYEDWTEWTTCSVSCAGGTQSRSRSRTCTNPPPAYGGADCQGSDTEVDSKSCNPQPCPIDGGWTDYTRWDDWSTCSVSCGGGSQARSRYRTCTNPAPAFGGAECEGETEDSEERECNTQHCPIDGGWTEFTEWTDYDECPVLCGNATKKQHRERDCTNPTPQYGGAECEGADSEDQFVTCNEEACGDRCPKDTVTYLSHPDNDQRFYQCANGRAALHSCPADTRWSQDSQTCIHEEQTTVATTATPGHFCTGRSTGYYANSDCHKYNRCVNGRLYEMSCASGLKWSQSASTCVRGDC
ncbi:coadhesin-like isoform X2 [Gigantopelta aegis]|uniref:coadhesin-like isoform X2 n=1 Tax=Gigantopelta aegis TaxID=1735272 RepID=UPI001B887F16|nr:coadhesin-like isoform X2 [Gigantopelta aegis]